MEIKAYTESTSMSHFSSTLAHYHMIVTNSQTFFFWRGVCLKAIVGHLTIDQGPFTHYI